MNVVEWVLWCEAKRLWETTLIPDSEMCWVVKAILGYPEPAN